MAETVQIHKVGLFSVVDYRRTNEETRETYWISHRTRQEAIKPSETQKYEKRTA